MNRRKVLKGALGLGAVAVAGKAAASEPEFYGPAITDLVPAKAEGSAVDYDPDYLYTEDWEAKYWEAQAHIDRLYEEMQSPLMWKIDGKWYTRAG